MKGTILSCVMGFFCIFKVRGKMSEGINFSDEYGRCVIVFGLPFPNNQDLELNEKINYLNDKNKGDGNQYYLNITMKLVNQSIGRSIRHINDYSCIILLDKRFITHQNKLPNWISNHLTIHQKFFSAFNDIKSFFEKKKY
jgi:chromosome transmission fidelity protein 1